jgi:hypothetical protein
MALPEQEQQPPSGEPPSDKSGPLTDMIVQTDQALTAISQVLAKASPEAAQAMVAINEQYRKIIESVMSGSGGAQQQGQQQAAPQMVSPETHGRPSQQAY